MSPAEVIALDTPLKFTAPGGVAYAGRGKWHLPQGDQPGKWMPDYETPPILCERGYHWCEARHAVQHLHAECWVIEPRGETVRGDDKCVSQGGRLLRRVETWNDRTARLFAADCAEAVAHLCGDDPRPREAIETARRHARGQATKAELNAACASAWASACAAARDAAWASACAAAWASARNAAWAAACAAARVAASDAAWGAARGAAWAAAWDAAMGAQTQLLLRYLNRETGYE